MTILFGGLDLGTPDGLIMGTQKEVLTLAVYARTRTAETSNVRQGSSKEMPAGLRHAQRWLLINLYISLIDPGRERQRQLLQRSGFFQ